LSREIIVFACITDLLAVFVHFIYEGSRCLARKVGDSILQFLAKYHTVKLHISCFNPIRFFLQFGCMKIKGKIFFIEEVYYA